MTIMETIKDRLSIKVTAILALVALIGVGAFTPIAVTAGDSDYEVTTVDDGGSMTGVVRFDSKYPKRKKIRISKDNETCGTIKRAEKFLVSKENKGLKNVLVTIKGITAGKAPHISESITLQQKGCVYVPHFQVAEVGPEGVDLKLVNDDGIFHNVHTYLGDSTVFNVPQLGTQHEITQKLSAPGVIKVNCDVHDWMSADIVLLHNSPYYSVTNKKGEFSIDDIPPGTYTVTAWHEALGTMTKEVTISDGENSQLDFVIKGKSKKKKK